jgi:hypothetical protein
MKVVFTVSDRPRPIEAALAHGGAASRLAARLLALDDAKLQTLRGVGAPSLLIVAGDDLPWVDGVVYLGRDRAAPQLYLPTTHEPAVPSSLIARAISRRYPRLPPPFAVLDEPRLIVSLAAAGPIDRQRLLAWQRAA